MRFDYFIEHFWNILWCMKMNLQQEAKTSSKDRNCKENTFGDCKNPHYFKDVKNLPVNYARCRKSRMTTAIAIQTFFLNGSRIKNFFKSLLSSDKCSSHPNDLKLTYIKLVFFPPNLTIQSLDQGWIIQPLDQWTITSLQRYTCI